MPDGTIGHEAQRDVKGIPVEFADREAMKRGIPAPDVKPMGMMPKAEGAMLIKGDEHLPRTNHPTEMDKLRGGSFHATEVRKS